MIKLGDAWLKDNLRSLAVTLIAAAIVVPVGCVCVCLPTYIAAQPEVDSTTTLVLLLIPLSLCFLIIFGGLGVGGQIMRRRRERRLDAAFAPLGLRGSPYLLNSRQYHGTVEGRQVAVYFYSYRGPTLDLRVSTPLQTRLAATAAAAVSPPPAWDLRYPPLALHAPGLQGLSISAQDEDWARALLGSPAVQEALQRLVRGEGWALFRQVFLQPGTLHLRLHHNRNLFRYDVSPADAQQWLDDLLTLLRIAESLPMPRVAVELTPAEQRAQGLRRSRTFPALTLIVILVLAMLPICLLLSLVIRLMLAGAR